MVFKGEATRSRHHRVLLTLGSSVSGGEGGEAGDDWCEGELHGGMTRVRVGGLRVLFAMKVACVDDWDKGPGVCVCVWNLSMDGWWKAAVQRYKRRERVHPPFRFDAPPRRRWLASRVPESVSALARLRTQCPAHSYSANGTNDELVLPPHDKNLFPFRPFRRRDLVAAAAFQTASDHKA